MVTLYVEDGYAVAFSYWSGFRVLRFEFARSSPVCRNGLSVPCAECTCRFCPSLVVFDEGFDPFYRYHLHCLVTYVVIESMITNMVTILALQPDLFCGKLKVPGAIDMGFG